MALGKGTFKIAVIGPRKEIKNKKDENNPYITWDLQFEGDPSWYNTFWTKKEDPQIGDELTGEKQDSQWGLKFEAERAGGKTNWSPAAANSTLMGAAVEAVNGFLSLGDHYEKWAANDETLGHLFKKYLATVESASKQLKEKVVSMGSLNAETKTSDTHSNTVAPAGDPPKIEGFGEDEEQVDL